MTVQNIFFFASFFYYDFGTEGKKSTSDLTTEPVYIV